MYYLFCHFDPFFCIVFVRVSFVRFLTNKRFFALLLRCICAPVYVDYSIKPIIVICSASACGDVVLMLASFPLMQWEGRSVFLCFLDYFFSSFGIVQPPVFPLFAAFCRFYSSAKSSSAPSPLPEACHSARRKSSRACFFNSFSVSPVAFNS